MSLLGLLSRSSNEITNCRIPEEKGGKTRGYAFCEFPDCELALSAIRNLNGDEMKSRFPFIIERQIRVNFANEALHEATSVEDASVENSIKELSRREKLFLFKTISEMFYKSQKQTLKKLIKSPKLIDVLLGVLAELEILTINELADTEKDPFRDIKIIPNVGGMFKVSETTETLVGKRPAPEPALEPDALENASKMTYKELIEREKLKKLNNGRLPSPPQSDSSRDSPENLQMQHMMQYPPMGHFAMPFPGQSRMMPGGQMLMPPQMQQLQGQQSQHQHLQGQQSSQMHAQQQLQLQMQLQMQQQMQLQHQQMQQQMQMQPPQMMMPGHMMPGGVPSPSMLPHFAHPAPQVPKDLQNQERGSKFVFKTSHN